MNEQKLKDLTVQLIALTAELQQEVIEDVKNVVIQPWMPDPYQSGKEFVFNADYNGNLTASDLQSMTDEWHQLIDTIKPFTYEMWKKRVDAGEYDPHARFWTAVGGLKIEGMSEAANAFRDLKGRWQAIAAERAMQARKEAGWTGKDYLTAPDGSRRGFGGYAYGPFTRP